MQRFYFQIPKYNILECIWAESFTDAKQKATQEWLPYWDKIEWLNKVSCCSRKQHEDPSYCIKSSTQAVT